MKQHPMVKAFVKALVKNGGKEFKNRFNMYQLDQTFVFGYRKFHFRIMSASLVSSWDTHLIPEGVTGRFDVVMIQQPNFGGWLACDSEAQAEYGRFIKLVNATFAPDPDV